MLTVSVVSFPLLLDRDVGAAVAVLTSVRAVLATRTLPPLPDAFPNPTLTMRLSFIYQ